MSRPLTFAAATFAGVVVFLLATWLLDEPADARRHRPAPEAHEVQAIDVGPKVVRTIRVDPCEDARTFVEAWRCRVK